LFFGVTYSPYSNLFFYAPDTMADRYMFVPSIGLALVAVHGWWRLAGANLARPSIDGAGAKACVGLFAVVVVGFSVRTVLASRDWRNDSTLIHNRIRYFENNAAAQAVYGHTLAQEGYRAADPETKRARKVAAMRAFTRAIEIYPDFQAAWISAGRLFAEQGIYDKAELAFLKAQRLEPLSPETYLCLGTLYLSQSDHELAIPYLEKSVLLDPKGEEAYVMLGKAYLQAGHLDNLGAMATTAVGWFPENVELRAQLATYQFRKGDYRAAVARAREVLAREPHNILARAIVSSPLTQDLASLAEAPRPRWGSAAVP
jgi:tetratricopeptide (TPR) repeat protein